MQVKPPLPAISMASILMSWGLISNFQARIPSLFSRNLFNHSLSSRNHSRSLPTNSPISLLHSTL